MLPRHPPRPDFAQLIRQIEATGLNRRAIAREIGVNRSTVTRWYNKTYRQPYYEHGQALLLLLAQRSVAKPPEESK